MVRFQCDGKRKKIELFLVTVWKCLVFSQNIGARYLIGNNSLLITCRLWDEGLLIRYLVHGKSMVKIFGRKLGISIKKMKVFQKKLQNTLRFVIF